MKIALTLLVLGSASSAQDILSDWVFDGQHIKDGTVTDATGAQKAKLVGSWRLQGSGDTQALALGGDSRVVITDDLAAAKLPARELTAEAWVAVSTPAEWGSIIGAIQDNGGYEKGWLLGNRNDRFCLAISSKGADDGDGVLTYLTAKNPFRPGRWHHVVGTYDGVEMRVYVNGKLEAASKAQSGDILYPPRAQHVIGAYADDDELYPLQGVLKQVRLYSRALSEAEVMARFQAAAQLAETAAGPQMIVGPYLTHVTQTSAAIMWETDQPATSVVEYGVRTPLDARAQAQGISAIHEVVLRGLEPESQYVYRVVSADAKQGEVASQVFTFRTAVRPGTPFAYVVVGDSRTYPDRWRRIAERAYAERPSFVLHVGDVVSNGDVKAQWLTEWLQPAAALMHRVPMYVAIGNHERNAHWYYDYVSYPKPENYYSFDFGNAHFTIVDTNQDLSPGSAQYRWLDRDLAESRARWKFAAHHHPPYSSDNDDYGDSRHGPSTLGDLTIRKITPMYEKYGVDIVWVGHIHDYERTWPIRQGRPVERGGVIYVQTGGGGAELEDFAPTRSPFTAKVKSDWQYCLVTINGGTLQLSAFDIEGRMYDYLQLTK